jgi:CSLREA domain-containing protein
MRHIQLLLIALLLTASLNLAQAPVPARAASTITVNTLNDDTINDGLCTLREAITNANGDTDALFIPFSDCATGSGNDTIKFLSGLTGSILLGLPLPALTDTDGVSIDGSAGKVTVNGNNTFRVFDIASGVTAIIKNLTITNGIGVGGNINNAGTLDLQNSTITNGNGLSGGAIYNNSGVITITNSTFIGNSANQGGVLYNNNGSVTITNSTIYNNSVWGGGTGILYHNGIKLLIKNTILANGNGTALCVGNALDGASANNLADDASCVTGFTQVTLAQLALGPLADNGGSTWTIGLLDGSAAINTAGACPPPNTDQRGITRPQGLQCDIGAFEVKASLTITPTLLAFGDQVAGTPSNPKTVTITNTSEGTITIGALTITETINGVTTTSDDFFLTGANTCTVPIPPAGACAFAVVFYPPSAIPPIITGAKTGSLKIPTSISATPYTVSLTGNSIFGTNLLLSPNFDVITKPIPWKSPSPSYSLTTVMDCTVFYSPLCSIHFSGSLKNKSWLIYQPLAHAGKAGERYLFRLSSLASSVPLGGLYKVDLVFLNTSNRPLGTFSLLFSTGTHDWEHLQAIVAAPANYYTMSFRIYFQKTSGDAWFDNAVLVKLP